MLVTVDYYRLVTGDEATSDSAASAFLAEAQQLVGEALHRELEYAERTEALTVRRGRVYPSAVPVAAVAPASATAGTVLCGGFAVGVSSVSPLTWPELEEQGAAYDDVRASYAPASLTYSGGYTSLSLPFTLRRAIARVAGALAAGDVSTRPAGATSVSLDGASVSYGPTAAYTGAAAEVERLVPGLAGGLLAAYGREVL